MHFLARRLKNVALSEQRIIVTVHGFKGLPAFGGAVGDQGSGVQGCILVPGLHFGGVFM